MIKLYRCFTCGTSIELADAVVRTRGFACAPKGSLHSCAGLLERVCFCGCKTSMEGRRPDAKFHSKKHKDDYWLKIHPRGAPKGKGKPRSRASRRRELNAQHDELLERIVVLNGWEKKSWGWVMSHILTSAALHFEMKGEACRQTKESA